MNSSQLPVMHIMHVPGYDPERDRIIEQQKAAHPLGEHGICVHEDPDMNGILWNYRRALRCAIENRRPAQRWVLVGQDDAIPVTGWERELPRALRYSPSSFLSLCHTGSHGIRLA